MTIYVRYDTIKNYIFFRTLTNAKRCKFIYHSINVR